jgi:hypothetical protein
MMRMRYVELGTTSISGNEGVVQLVPSVIEEQLYTPYYELNQTLAPIRDRYVARLTTPLIRRASGTGAVVEFRYPSTVNKSATITSDISCLERRKLSVFRFHGFLCLLLTSSRPKELFYHVHNPFRERWGLWGCG